MKIIRVEIIGQQEYFDTHGHFPNDQRAFAEAYRMRFGHLLLSRSPLKQRQNFAFRPLAMR